MKKVLLLAACALLLSSGMSFAGSKAGAIITNTQTGNVTQVGGGIGNKQDAQVGSVKMKNSQAGAIITNTKTKNITQVGGGIGNKQTIGVGSVEMN